MKKRVLALLLTLVMLVSCFPMNLIAKTSSSIAGTADGPLSLTAREGKSGFATGREGKGSTANTHQGKLNTDRFELSSTPFSENDAAASLRSGDEVTFIVVLKSASLLGNYSVREISERTEAVKSQESKQIKAIDSAKKQAAEALGKSKHEFGFDYTVAMTGFSVTTAYGNRKKLEALNGVESVYVAPTFALPETDYDLAPLTNNASTMIGSDILNSSGYGGKGMRIAILDTGILVTHPNFAALPDDKLDDPITRQSVDDIWYTLNAGKSTPKLNRSYYNTKLPFIFNYATADFDVSNTYAGSDHGTHVAGIAAANKIVRK